MSLMHPRFDRPNIELTQLNSSWSLQQPVMGLKYARYASRKLGCSGRFLRRQTLDATNGASCAAS
eukprot:1587772-Amphidinium_carterae.1